jgi:hypothetical protein
MGEATDVETTVIALGHTTQDELSRAWDRRANLKFPIARVRISWRTSGRKSVPEAARH